MNKTTFFKSTVYLLLLLLCSILFLQPEVFAASTATEAPAIQLTEEEMAYLDRTGEITIGCPVKNCPLLFQDEKTGEVKGITVDVLDMLSEATGLTFHYQALPSGDITYHDLQQLELDMVAGVESNDLNKHAPPKLSLVEHQGAPFSCSHMVSCWRSR